MAPIEAAVILWRLVVQRAIPVRYGPRPALGGFHLNRCRRAGGQWLFFSPDTAAHSAASSVGSLSDPANPLSPLCGILQVTMPIPRRRSDMSLMLSTIPTTGKATWKDISYSLGNMPVTGVKRQQGTLEPLLTTPLRREELLLGKAIGGSRSPRLQWGTSSSR